MTNQTGQDNRSNYEVQFPGLPLAVYAEIVAHLRQVEGVVTGLYPQTGQFNYNYSQIGSLWIRYTYTVTPASRARVEQILEYYQNRYGIS